MLNTTGRILSYFEKIWNTSSYSYLQVGPNTLMYDVIVLMRKYAHICWRAQTVVHQGLSVKRHLEVWVVQASWSMRWCCPFSVSQLRYVLPVVDRGGDSHLQLTRRCSSRGKNEGRGFETRRGLPTGFRSRKIDRWEDWPTLLSPETNINILRMTNLTIAKMMLQNFNPPCQHHNRKSL